MQIDDVGKRTSQIGSSCTLLTHISKIQQDIFELEIMDKNQFQL